jgi:hypothetical protein
VKVLKYFICVLALGVFSCQDRNAEVQNKIPYVVYREWDIPNGGHGKEIVISPSFRNDSDLTTLGLQLKREAQHDRHSFVAIYDDEDAVRMRKDAVTENLSKEDLEFHDKHIIAMYSKNGNTGFHQFNYGLNGFMTDPIVSQDY